MPVLTAQSSDFVHALTPEGTLSGQIVHAREPIPAAAEDRTQAIDRALAERRDYLNEIARTRLPGVRAVIDVEGSEHTARAIVERAKRIGASFIAMGTHGRTGLAHVLMGSVAEAVVRHAEVPVLVVGPNAAIPS